MRERSVVTQNFQACGGLRRPYTDEREVCLCYAPPNSISFHAVGGHPPGHFIQCLRKYPQERRTRGGVRWRIVLGEENRVAGKTDVEKTSSPNVVA